MNKNIAVFIIATTLLLSSFVMTFGASGNGEVTAGSNSNTPFPSFVGNVYVYPNGTVSAPTVISLTSGQYTILQDINGGVYFERNNSALNGSGHTINVVGPQGISLSNISNVVVSDVHIVGAGAGVLIQNASHITVTGATLSSSGEGILSAYSSYVTFTSNNYYGSSGSDFITLSYMKHVTVSSNSGYFSGSGTMPLFVAFSSNVLISYNDFYAPTYGISIIYSSYVQSQYNLVNNTGTSGPGMSIQWSNHYSSSHDTVINSAGDAIFLFVVNNANIQYGNFNNSTSGSFFININNLSISYCDFSNVSGSSSIQLEFVNNLNISNSKFLEYANSSVIAIDITSDTGSASFYGDNIYAPSGTGILLNRVASSEVIDTYIDAVTDVKLTASASGFSAIGNTLAVETSGVGILVSSNLTSDISVKQNIIYSATGLPVTGISFQGTTVQNVNISGNQMENMIIAVLISDQLGQQISVSNNYIKNASTGMVLISAYHSRISGNNIVNVSQAGIEIMGGNSIQLFGNSVVNLTPLAGSSAIGMLLISSLLSDLAVSGNLVSTSNSTGTLGIIAEEVLNSTFSDNTFLGAQFAVKLIATISTSFYGNYVNNSEYGLQLSSNENFSIYNNWIGNTNYSFFSAGDRIGTVYGNTFISALNYTLNITSDSYVTFYHNNFINGNMVKASIVSSTGLKWNLSAPIGGNYWSNYTGIAAADGFGSTPYVINSLNRDYLPLTSKWLSPTVTFTETGLPAGTAWTINFIGTAQTSTTDTIVFSIGTAQYHNETFSVASVPGYVVSQGSGSIYLDGLNKTVTLQFTQKTYSVTFTQNGLPAGTTWSVTLNGTTKSTSTSSVLFTMPNGTYSYTIGSVPGYQTTATGQIVVSGNSVTVNKHFIAIEYNLTISQTGLPAGTVWSVMVGNVSYNSSGIQITVPLVSGTYNITATAPSGYTISLQASNITLNNAPASFNITFTKKGSSAIYVGLGVGIVVGAAAIMLASFLVTGNLPFMGRKKKS